MSKNTFIVSFILILLAGLASCQKTDSQITEEQLDTIYTVSVSSKLKQGLARLVEIYDREGKQSATVFASENGIFVEEGKVNVHIYTIGDESEVFVDDLQELDINQFNASSLNNVIQATVTIEQLLVIAEQDFVLYIMPMSKTYVIP
jgi:hypothetical protein